MVFLSGNETRNPVQLDMPWDEIRRWHTSVCNRCIEKFQLCLDVIECELENGQRISEVSARDALACLLRDRDTCCLFGAPGCTPVVLPTGADVSSEAERQRWGRRFGYHFGVFKDGLRLWSRIDRCKSISEHLKTVEVLEANFSSTFPALATTIEDLKRAATPGSGPFKLARFLVSYIDPIPHSALVYLTRYDRELEHNLTLRDFLTHKIRETLELLMAENGDVARYRLVADDANLWWTQSELLRRERTKYRVGNATGFEGAAAVCRELISKDRNMSTPSAEMAIYETPPEVYGMYRTRLLVLKNCFDIAVRLPADADIGLTSELSQFSRQQFHAVNAEEIESLYLLGVALQVTSTALLYHERVYGGSSGTGVSDEHDLSATTSVAYSGGNNLFVVKYDDREDWKAIITSNFGILLEALVKRGGVANSKQLTEDTGIEYPGRSLQRGLDNPEFAPLVPHVTMPKKRGAGGYRMAIKPWPSDDAIAGD